MGEEDKEKKKKDRRKNIKVPTKILISLKKLAAYKMQSMKDTLGELVDNELRQIRYWEEEVRQ